jgi:menaquinone-dependent protoporphyrinogen oxidase
MNREDAMSRRVLVLYGSTYGHTATIARRIGAVLEADGNLVTLRAGDAIPRGTSPRDFDGVVIGASVIAGRHQRAVRAFARQHHHALNDVPSAFFSVSASAASFDEHGRSLARECLAKFLRQTGWYPALTESIAGAIRYTRYNPLVRWWMRRICAKAGGPTDTSRDHELTDWVQVERFAEAFDVLLDRTGSREMPAWAVRRERSGPRIAARPLARG